MSKNTKKVSTKKTNNKTKQKVMNKEEELLKAIMSAEQNPDTFIEAQLNENADDLTIKDEEKTAILENNNEQENTTEEENTDTENNIEKRVDSDIEPEKETKQTYNPTNLGKDYVYSWNGMCY